MYQTSLPAPRRILDYRASPVEKENVTETTDSRIRAISLDQDIAHRQQTLERILAETDQIRAETDALKREAQVLHETLGRQIDRLEKVNNQTTNMLEQILRILQATASSTGVLCDSPPLIDLDDKKSSSAPGDLVDFAGCDDGPSSKDISSSRRADDGVELTALLLEETKPTEQVRTSQFPLLCNSLTSLSITMMITS
jgi:hypothetical protein